MHTTADTRRVPPHASALAAAESPAACKAERATKEPQWHAAAREGQPMAASGTPPALTDWGPSAQFAPRLAVAPRRGLLRAAKRHAAPAPVTLATHAAGRGAPRCVGSRAPRRIEAAAVGERACTRLPSRAGSRTRPKEKPRRPLARRSAHDAEGRATRDERPGALWPRIWGRARVGTSLRHLSLRALGPLCRAFCQPVWVFANMAVLPQALGGFRRRGPAPAADDDVTQPDSH
eukprot:scaffold1206_cov388-Prasinococcus_capsulatus_cf.AAC.48